jgi:hypothetical protein
MEVKRKILKRKCFGLIIVREVDEAWRLNRGKNIGSIDGHRRYPPFMFTRWAESWLGLRATESLRGSGVIRGVGSCAIGASASFW